MKIEYFLINKNEIFSEKKMKNLVFLFFWSTNFLILPYFKIHFKRVFLLTFIDFLFCESGSSEKKRNNELIAVVVK